MPPYAGDFLFSNSSNNAYADATPVKPETIPEGEEAEAQPKSSPLDGLLDFNPCVSFSGGGHSMSSAMFKTRSCAWCGKGCNKLKGYKKEVIEGIAINEETGEEEPANTKIYYHNWCFQLKEFKQAHQEGWQKVMSGLLGHFRAIELAEQRRKDDEARARREAALKADEARRAADEKRREAEEQRRIEEEERLAAEEARFKKEASMTYKMGKKMSAFKKAVTAPCKSKKAVNEDATGDAPEQFPNYDY